MQILHAADTDKSGQIDYTEFLAATMDAQIFLRNDYLRTAFDMFDKDKSGKIDIGEISECRTLKLQRSNFKSILLRWTRMATEKSISKSLSL